MHSPLLLHHRVYLFDLPFQILPICLCCGHGNRNQFPIVVWRGACPVVAVFRVGVQPSLHSPSDLGCSFKQSRPAIPSHLGIIRASSNINSWDREVHFNPGVLGKRLVTPRYRGQFVGWTSHDRPALPSPPPAPPSKSQSSGSEPY